MKSKLEGKEHETGELEYSAGILGKKDRKKSINSSRERLCFVTLGSRDSILLSFRKTKCFCAKLSKRSKVSGTPRIAGYMLRSTSTSIPQKLSEQHLNSKQISKSKTLDDVYDSPAFLSTGYLDP